MIKIFLMQRVNSVCIDPISINRINTNTIRKVCFCPVSLYVAVVNFCALCVSSTTTILLKFADASHHWRQLPTRKDCQRKTTKIITATDINRHDLKPTVTPVFSGLTEKHYNNCRERKTEHHCRRTLQYYCHGFLCGESTVVRYWFLTVFDSRAQRREFLTVRHVQQEARAC